MFVCYKRGTKLRVIDVDTTDHRQAIALVQDYANEKHPKSIKSPILAVLVGSKAKRAGSVRTPAER